ncbi:serine/threonine protein kinase [Streptomyces sp. WAC 06738]|uniref:protein kinase domain-containing protein n=1 Tax=Streptomyces sp. WAC 06738 TaxID=2203210 RepID=UPI000F6D11DF|nr:protein kinase [Streptomyces sp. WAC 06738]AZM47335.1 serine/threonine protein kinase [Streptomyces sp. WAC 06738]
MTEYGGQDDYAGRSVGGGRYRLLDLLGTGGMASVHLAHDTVLDRQVAVKTLHTELGREDSFRERFRREAQAVARLSHQNVVSVFDTGEDRFAGDGGGPVPYIVMEYVEGRPLRSVLDEDVAQFGAMPTEKALRIVSDVLAALDASHEMGLVHRDIKPGNVMMTRREQVKVMDFGIARAVQSGVTSMTQTGMVVGTPQYLSPEQALGRGVDARSDLYSVGVMLFELLTGRLPFDADSPLAIAYAHVQEPPPAPSSINMTVPPVVDALVARALAKNPDERFRSAEEMREEVRRAGGMTPPGAMPSVVAGAHARDSGAGVGSAVFPPVNPYHSPPPGAPTPYQPMQQQGFGPPQPQQQQPHGGYATPQPYSLSPQGAPGGGHGGGKGNRNAAVIGLTVVIAMVVIAATAIILVLNGGDDGDPEAKPTGQTEQPTSDPTAGPGDDSGGEGDAGGKGENEMIPPDRSRTIDKTRCTEPMTDPQNEKLVRVPDFTFKDYQSVRECLRAAQWSYEVDEEPDELWGKDTVLEQNFDEYDDYFDPSKDKLELVIATGYKQ